MKSRMSMLVMMAAVCLSACGGGGSPPPPSNANEWTWMSGANVVYQPGTYGTLGDGWLQQCSRGSRFCR
jgi:hypothetical protein